MNTISIVHAMIKRLCVKLRIAGEMRHFTQDQSNPLDPSENVPSLKCNIGSIYRPNRAHIKCRSLYFNNFKFNRHAYI